VPVIAGIREGDEERVFNARRFHAAVTEKLWVTTTPVGGWNFSTPWGRPGRAKAEEIQDIGKMKCFLQRGSYHVQATKIRAFPEHMTGTVSLACQ